MTREDYILKPHDCYDYKAMTKANEQVNKIFDVLEYEKCINCHYSIDNVYCALHTFYDDDFEVISQLSIMANFSCNKFEAKE